MGQLGSKKSLLYWNGDPKFLKKEKATIGITALSFLREQIEGKVCDLDVELKFPFGAEATKVRLFVF